MRIIDLFKKDIIRIREPLTKDFIEWKDGYTTKESDYQGIPWGIFSGYDAMTATCKLISVDAKITRIDSNEIYFKIIEFKVIAFMSKSESWIDPQSKQHTPIGLLLNHEFGHFMIEEAYAKKLRKKMIQKFKNEFICKKIDSEPVNITVRNNLVQIINELRETCKLATEKYHGKYDKFVHERGRLIPEKQKQFYESIVEMFHAE